MTTTRGACLKVVSVLVFFLSAPAPSYIPYLIQQCVHARGDMNVLAHDAICFPPAVRFGVTEYVPVGGP